MGEEGHCRPTPEINSDKCTGEPAGSSLVSAPELGGIGDLDQR